MGDGKEVLVTGECWGGQLADHMYPPEPPSSSFFSVNSLGHLLLPDYLPRLVIAQVSNPSPVFLVLFTPNQTVKRTFPWGLLSWGVFVIRVVE